MIYKIKQHVKTQTTLFRRPNRLWKTQTRSRRRKTLLTRANVIKSIGRAKPPPISTCKAPLPAPSSPVPCKEEPADFDSTQHVFIEAENLEALKILQKSYAGSVKMIFIGPPTIPATVPLFIPTNSPKAVKNTSAAWAIPTTRATWSATACSKARGAKTAKTAAITTATGSPWCCRACIWQKPCCAKTAWFLSALTTTNRRSWNCCVMKCLRAENFVEQIIWEKKFSPKMMQIFSGKSWLPDLLYKKYYRTINQTVTANRRNKCSL